MKERWKKIPGFDQNYEVSNMGRVKTLEHTIIRNNGRPQHIRERILKQSLDECGYPQVRLKGKTAKVHRLIGIAFMGERKEGDVIRHLDGNPQNNNIRNLKYGTPSENLEDCYRYNGYLKKDQKLSREKAREIKEMIYQNIPNRSIAKKYGVSEQSICDIKHNRIYSEV